MDGAHTLAKQFNDAMEKEINRLEQDKGELFARTARCAYAASNLFSLLSHALSARPGESNFDRIPEMVDGIGMMVSTMLANVAEGLDDAQIKQTMAWADHMMDMQNAMIESLASSKQ